MKSSLALLIASNINPFFRDRGIVFWALVVPILVGLVFGWAVQTRGKPVPRIALVAEDESSVGKAVPLVAGRARGAGEVRTIQSGSAPGPSLELRVYDVDAASAEDLLRDGSVDAIVQLENGRRLYYFDPASLEGNVAFYSSEGALSGWKGEPPSFAAANPRYADYLLPGIVALLIANNSLFGIAGSFANKRQRGMLKRIAMSPVPRSHIFVGSTIARIVLSGMETSLFVGLSVLLLGLQIHGSWLSLVLLFLVGNLCFAGLATLLGARSANGESASRMLSMVMLLLVAFSGIFFDLRVYPDWALPILHGLPLTMLADALRTAFSHRIGVEQVEAPLVMLSLFGVLFFTIGTRIFRWE